MKIVILFCIYFLFTIASAAESDCKNKVANVYWEELALQSPNKKGITNLINLRKQLCRQIKTGEISTDDAIKIFERERRFYADDIDLERGRF